MNRSYSFPHILGEAFLPCDEGFPQNMGEALNGHQTESSDSSLSESIGISR